VLLGDPIGVIGHGPEHAFGAGVAARERRALLRRAAGAHEDAGARRERKVERGLHPVEAGLDVGLPGRGEIRPAQLVQPTHPRLRAGVQHQDLGADVSEDALAGPRGGARARARLCCPAGGAAWSRATTVTLAPWSTRASTSPRPRPRLPPVTTMVLSLRLIGLLPRLVSAEPRTFGAAEKSHHLRVHV